MSRVSKKPVISLYDNCLTNVISNSSGICNHGKLDSLPDQILCDIFLKALSCKKFLWLSYELSEYRVLIRILSVKHKRTELIKVFGAVKDFDPKVDQYVVQQFQDAIDTSNGQDYSIIEYGLRIGSFFSEMGWYPIARDILNMTEEYCKRFDRNVHILKMFLDIYYRRIFVESSYSLFHEAGYTFELATNVVQELHNLHVFPNLCGLYAHFAHLFIMRSEYDNGYNWAQKAVSLLDDSLSDRLIVDVLRISSRACVFKRKFAQAALLIEQAFCLAEKSLDSEDHPAFADTLIDYAFYHLNTDRFDQSVKLYTSALEMRTNLFGLRSLKVAFVKEDLAYSMYVYEYSSGNFLDAINVVTQAIDALTCLVPKGHLALASTHRVKALILEEMAIDMRHQANHETREKFFLTAEGLHKEALDISLQFFGENNVHTAKQYGNLGRLYQSMNRYEQAERMHLHAIKIKEQLLGTDNYEVGLSLGHLASLYNFHMRRYRDAEKLYLRSIEISLNLFGTTYSCLEYDYRGLIKVYSELEELEELDKYNTIIRDWRNMRKDKVLQDTPITELSVQAIIQIFLKQC